MPQSPAHARWERLRVRSTAQPRLEVSASAGGSTLCGSPSGSAWIPSLRWAASPSGGAGSESLGDEPPSPLSPEGVSVPASDGLHTMHGPQIDRGGLPPE